jgi:hypothetical protein
VNMLAYHDADFLLQVETGRIEVMVGGGSEDIGLMDAFEITGEKNMPIEKRIFVCPVEIQ